MVGCYIIWQKGLVIGKNIVERWVTYVIFVENKGPWCIVVQMLHAYVCPVTEMSTLLMPYQNATQEHYYVKDAIHNLL